MHEFWRNYYGNEYGHFSNEERKNLRDKAKEMFYFGYDSYMKFAFPQVSPSKLPVKTFVSNFPLLINLPSKLSGQCVIVCRFLNQIADHNFQTTL